ncbi:hypothetical protein EOPP23_16215 [Endozoicomonas sp. OPT23]|nr:hypothetical protein [Endozoicomonas sp. OPT23]
MKAVKDSIASLKPGAWMTGVVLLLVSMNSAHAADGARKTVMLCADKAYWYPFTYQQQYRAHGLFVDMIKEVGLRTDTRFVVRPAKWSRCLRLAKSGKVDGILGASYKKERAEWMNYPADATSGKPSPYSMSLVDYVIATPVDSSYVFDGNTANLPAPVRVPRSYSIADDLKKQGAAVKASFSSDRSALLGMARQNNGSAALLGSIANELVKNDRNLRGKYKIQDRKLKAKDYFLTFSAQSKLTAEEKNNYWEALHSVRNDEGLMSHFYENYAGEAAAEEEPAA